MAPLSADHRPAMNPRATDFTPAMGPNTRVLRPVAPTPGLLFEHQYVATRPAAPVPGYDFRRQTVLSSQNFQPEIAYNHNPATSQLCGGLIPGDTWSQGGHAAPWGQHQSFAEAADPPDVRSPQQTVSAFATQSPGLKHVHGLPSSAIHTASSHPRPLPGTREATSGGSHTTKVLANREHTPMHSSREAYQHRSDMEPQTWLSTAGGEIRSPMPQVGTTASATHHGYPYNAEDNQTSVEPNRGQALAISATQQAPFPNRWTHFQSNPDIHNAQQAPHPLEAVDQHRPQNQPPSPGRISVSKSPRERGQTTCRTLRSERTKRQRSHLNTGVHRRGDIQGGTSSSQSYPDVSRILEQPHGYPSPQSQPQDLSGMTLLSSAHASTESQMLSPAPTSSSAERSTPPQRTPVQGPTRISFRAPGDHAAAILKDVFSSQYHKPEPLRVVVDFSQSHHSLTNETPQQARLGNNRALEPYAQRYNDGVDNIDFRPDSERNVMKRRAQRGCVGGAVFSSHMSAPFPGPSGAPQQDTFVVCSHRLGNIPSHVHGPQMTSLEGTSSSAADSSLRASAQQPRMCAPPESGSWSNSKRWMSEETKERVAFSKMMNNLRHIGADKSPFIPQTLTELAILKADVAEANRQELTRVVGRRLAELERRKSLTQVESKQIGVKVEELFWGKRFNDNMSPVFASRNCFNEHVPDDHGRLVDWSSLAELKDEGDKRGGRYRRYLPLPRFNVVDTRTLATKQEEVFHPDGNIRWQTKAVNPNPAFITPVSPPEKQASTAKTISVGNAELEPRLQELPEHVQATIRDIEYETGLQRWRPRRYWISDKASVKQRGQVSSVEFITRQANRLLPAGYGEG